MRQFDYETSPSRVIFGRGTLGRLTQEIDRLSLSNVIILSTAQQAGDARALASMLSGRSAGIFDRATMHTPINITEDALRHVTERRVDGLVSLGGGSTIGLGKAIAFRTDMPQIVIPTTYAGSEMTPILGETENGLKVTKRDPRILPETVIYDVDLTMTLPPALSATSGMNALAHAAEALYAQDTNPIISMMAEEAIGALYRSLPTIVERPDDAEARSDALYGAWLCGMCLGSAGMALHHKLCHVLGGSFDLPHAETHTIILPHALAYNFSAAPEAMRRIAKAIGDADVAGALHDFVGSLGVSRALRDIGMPEEGIEKAADIAVSNPYWNPRPIDRTGIRDLIARAWAGQPPGKL